MARVPKRVADRIKASLPRYQKILEQAKNRDVNESDTVTIVVDILADVFGYDKYSELTSEMAIRGEFCDVAVVVDDKVKFLIEVKSIGLDLKSNHLRQALNYGANAGIQWVLLTNGAIWQAHSIRFEKPVSSEQVFEFNLGEMSARSAQDIETLFLLCRESLKASKSAIEEYHEHSQIVNRHTISAILQSDDVYKTIRKHLKRLSPKSKVTTEEIAELVRDSLKRDLIEGESADKAVRLLRSMQRRHAAKKHSQQSVSVSEPMMTDEP